MPVHDVDDNIDFQDMTLMANSLGLCVVSTILLIYQRRKIFTINYVLILFVIIILKFIENSPGNSCYYKHFTTGQVLIAKGNIKTPGEKVKLVF